MSALVSVDLPAPGAPVMPDGVGPAAEGVGQAADVPRRFAAALDQRQQPGQRGPVAGPGAPSSRRAGRRPRRRPQAQLRPPRPR